MKKLLPLILLSAACASQSTTPSSPAVTATAAPAASASHYHVVRHIPIGGESGWDYLTMDSDSHRLFVSHGDRVHVVDTATGTVVGTIPNTQGVHGIALAPALNRGFVSDGKTSSVTVFDLNTLAVLSEIKIQGQRPDAIIFDPFTSRVFTFNAGTNDSTVIDGATGAIVGTIDLGGKPEFAVSDGSGHVYVNIEDTAEVVSFETRSLSVLARWSLAPCEEPSGLALDREHRRLFSGCNNKMIAISDPDRRAFVTTVPAGEGIDANAFDPEPALAFSSNGVSGTLTIVHEATPQSFQVVGNVPTQKGARTMALDVKTHHLYLATAQFGPTPAATTENPHPPPSILPGTFEILDVAP